MPSSRQFVTRHATPVCPATSSNVSPSTGAKCAVTMPRSRRARSRRWRTSISTSSPVTNQDVVSSLLYPRVFADYLQQQEKYSDLSVLPTPVFFYGMEAGDEISVDIEEGKRLIIKFLTVGDPHPDGRRLVFFELN